VQDFTLFCHNVVDVQVFVRVGMVLFAYIEQQYEFWLFSTFNL
jgi:hypothetical protein